MKKASKYNLIIYGSLFLALICLLLGGRDYLKDLDKDPTQRNIEEAEEYIVERTGDIDEKEPEELKNGDKASIIQKYFDSIIDQVQADDLLTLKMIKSWGSYEITNITYQREIVTNYYEYIVDIKIPNLDAELPSGKNEEASTEEYIVLTLYIDIIKSDIRNGYVVKNIDAFNE